MQISSLSNVNFKGLGVLQGTIAEVTEVRDEIEKKSEYQKINLNPNQDEWILATGENDLGKLYKARIKANQLKPNSPEGLGAYFNSIREFAKGFPRLKAAEVLKKLKSGQTFDEIVTAAKKTVEEALNTVA